MTFVLDTSILIAIERREKNVIEQLEKLSKTDSSPAKITFVNYFEFILGIKNKNPKNQDKLLEFIDKFAVLQTTMTTAHILAEFKHNYEQKGVVLSLSDLLIAALTMQNNMVLITKDRDFEKISELQKIVL